MPNLETLHYGGKVRLVFREKNHTYWANGKKVPTVSELAGILDTPSEDFTATKSELLQMYAVKQTIQYLEEHAPGGRFTPELLKQAKTAFRRVTQDAADVGTAVHAWCQHYITNSLAGAVMPPLPGDPRTLNGALAFLNWISEHSVVFHASEKRLYSKKHKYAGTTDIIATIDGVRSIGDFKTSKRMYLEHALQLAGYKVAHNEEFADERVIDRWVIMLNKETGEFDAKRMTNPDDEKTFVSLVPVYHRMYQPITE